MAADPSGEARRPNNAVRRVRAVSAGTGFSIDGAVEAPAALSERFLLERGRPRLRVRLLPSVEHPGSVCG
ncbi:hypothetical protein PSMK_19590 [Phycisphaera mikurensis NBRC 102666]|uniref:Uncharacterized protein n=1 Tax=Phycisphaera mikurensis (strain NBRC 102666 / KCTC 22515 / FYK2301M01) TaxID=1142394 RepID=I0IFT0_PHYMF|nr:hypothetical protein PSMK_19590 [Phycisphaera mikurensis NBRC 102666]